MSRITVLPVFLLFLILILALPILIGIYVYKDASRRGMNAALWTLLAIFAPGFVGLIIYLIVRSNYSDACCHKCGKPVRESFMVCPHCGASLKEHCYNCNGSLEGGWANCPHCGSPIPEEQKARMSVAPKKDKGLRRLLLVLILIPIAFCILLIFLVSLFGIAKTQSGGYSLSYTTEASLEEFAETQPFIKEWVADCDTEGTGVYVLPYEDNHPADNTYCYFIYRNDGYYNSYIDIRDSGFFSQKHEAHLTYSMPSDTEYLKETGMEEAPTYTLTYFDYTGDELDGLRIFDASGKELDYN